MKKGTQWGEGGREDKGRGRREGHQFTGHSSQSVEGKTQNGGVDAWTTLITKQEYQALTSCGFSTGPASYDYCLLGASKSHRVVNQQPNMGRCC